MKTYWTMKNGTMIDVDEMDEQHLCNTLKMIIRKNKRMYDASNSSQEMDELYNELLGDYNAEDFGCK